MKGVAYSWGESTSISSSGNKGLKKLASPKKRKENTSSQNNSDALLQYPFISSAFSWLLKQSKVLQSCDGAADYRVASYAKQTAP
ncbi:hypothetical protein KY285_011718 [Solanum tuberosum]|nr:hypothetical protein KY285_011718 [Solanum tuberosum]